MHRFLSATPSAGIVRSGGLTGLRALEIWLAAACAAIAIAWLPLSPAANATWLALALLRTVYSIAVALGGLAVFTALLALALGAVAPFFVARRRYRSLFVLAAVFAVFATAFVNVRPITLYFDLIDAVRVDGHVKKIATLGLANGMFFFFFYFMIADIAVEARRLYVQAARFRGAGELKSLLERATWTYLATLNAVFYYAFSFTLFGDILFFDDTFSGILGVVFNAILQKGWSEQATFNLVAMLAGVLVMRQAIQWLAYRWEIRRDLVGAA